MRPFLGVDFSGSNASRNTLFHGVYLTVIGNPFILAFLRTLETPVILTATILVHTALGLAVGIWLVFHRELKPRTVSIIDAILIVPYFFSIWFSQLLTVPNELDWLFIPKLLAFSWAVVVPGSYRLHVIFIVLLGVESLVMWDNATELGMRISDAEPWFTVLAFWMALSLLVLRQRQRRFEHEVIELQTRNEVLTEIAVVFLRVRDLSNTPLQSLLLSSELLKRGYPVSAETLTAIKQSVAKLQTLMGEFSRYEDRVVWDKGHLISFESEPKESEPRA